ncbi:MAG: dialkylresorcinol condensing enzyme DarA [Flavobacterium sp.]|nr:MAG: dialkylresorcinol condensing enzyme DarA [Flavobacterium sp.]
MTNVLVVYYSQSGQLKEIANQITAPLASSEDINLVFHRITPVRGFPFPWTKKKFFDVFPESFRQVPCSLKPVPTQILEQKYDLVLLCYTVWYLSPSIPVNSFLKSPEAAQLLNGVPVITISGSRNMWFMAQEKVKALLSANNAKLKGNIALVDRAANLVSVVTIVRWMFSGMKKRHLGIFPLPGVSEKDITDSKRFGRLILRALEEGKLDTLQPKLVRSGAVKISSYLLRVDKTANKIFKKWSALIASKKRSRRTWLKVFNIYLLLAIWLISPIVYILHAITYPFQIRKIKKQTAYFQGVYQQ